MEIYIAYILSLVIVIILYFLLILFRRLRATTLDCKMLLVSSAFTLFFVWLSRGSFISEFGNVKVTDALRMNFFVILVTGFGGLVDNPDGTKVATLIALFYSLTYFIFDLHII